MLRVWESHSEFKFTVDCLRLRGFKFKPWGVLSADCKVLGRGAKRLTPARLLAGGDGGSRSSSTSGSKSIQK